MLEGWACDCLWVVFSEISSWSRPCLPARFCQQELCSLSSSLIISAGVFGALATLIVKHVYTLGPLPRAVGRGHVGSGTSTISDDPLHHVLLIAPAAAPPLPEILPEAGLCGGRLCR